MFDMSAGVALGDELADALGLIGTHRDQSIGDQSIGVQTIAIVVAGERIELAPGDSIVIGRAGSRAVPGADGSRVFGIDHPTVSRRHVRLVFDGDEMIAEDLGSRNGTTLVRAGGSTPLSDPIAIVAGDRLVTVGDVLLAEIGPTR